MRKFLGAFAAIAAGFATNANAVVSSHDVPTIDKENAAKSVKGVIPSEQVAVRTTDGSIFDFVLKRDEISGEMMAYHSSHSSHASHRSHSSHYSGR